ncbi:hypothetical protein [Staphylococcus massiliensis]|uniref:N-acetyltransferase domain-containing protein n=1 Tax=Staphylococcus massiliensis S46 TaxID=1229783 RepID=K9B354_9STAP|nr:hypothetical protein [Staphylococcus massiliensis]EKU48210.1 hypothetical protein C273_05872 [Staphylococcus massiliensis S46]MCG3399528.1 hypothetical protein [Staphylococcus massiliensis]MCG3402037.1 hypothetical protein [Staphylococcus massiliensis]POA00755.1 hypothetical protein CD133_03555 [Staphylococcus massiliensis CCUG 55927]
MKFKCIDSVNDPLYAQALSLYEGKLSHDVSEKTEIFEQSLENDMTKDDYVFLVGLEDNKVVSLATAHYEATTNSSFLIYLISKESPDCERILSLTLEEVEEAINQLSQKVHQKDVNFMMFESTHEGDPNQEQVDPDIQFRKQFLRSHGFIKQKHLDYIQPNLHGNGPPIPMDLYIKANIELTKDIYGTSVKSNYILKYVFANKIPRRKIYPLLVKMDLRKA